MCIASQDQLMYHHPGRDKAMYLTQFWGGSRFVYQWHHSHLSVVQLKWWEEDYHQAESYTRRCTDLLLQWLEG